MFKAINNASTYEKKKKTLLALGDSIIKREEEQFDKLLDAFINQQLDEIKPLDFNAYSENSEPIKSDRNFQKLCIVLSKYSNLEPSDLTVIKFYSLLDHVKDELRKNKQAENGSPEQ